MRIIRFLKEDITVLAALTNDEKIYILPYGDFLTMMEEAEVKQKSILLLVEEVIKDSLPIDDNVNSLSLLTPVDAPEVWAAGVTYEKSREARNYEATEGKLDSKTFYDKVYSAPRPEIFFKSTSRRTIGPNEAVYLRSDSIWQIPEPELGLVIDKKGNIVGYTIGNDMSCRDIEGENPLYLPQAKMWKHSCSVGPAIRLVDTIVDPYNFKIRCTIYRNYEKVFEGTGNTSRLKRKFEELISYLIKDNEIFDGTILLTGTCIVPPNEFTLKDEDIIEIEISEIGILKNIVREQLSLNV